MIPRECKRLAEVDFPIAVVSKHAAREKSIYHGHPSTLHLWWARRPLAACRAVLLGLLLPDPCDPQCPAGFKKQAREILLGMHGRPQGWTAQLKGDAGLRQVLLRFIGDFANWDVAASPAYLNTGRGLVKAAHPEETPLVVDPFAGGGSIPLEALRLGCEAFASDLNPVACLILKVMLEEIPRHGPALAEELRRVGAEVKRAAEKELAEFYPPDPDGAKPIAYLWARTVRCETPNCGAEIPLLRSFWLCKKANRRRALRIKVVRPKGKAPGVEFEVFEPASEKEVPAGTVTRAKATCLCCQTVLSPDRVRAQLREHRGGADVIFDKKGIRVGGARLLAVVTLRPGEIGRHYRLPTEQDYEAVWKAGKRLEKVAALKLPNGLSVVPDEPLPKERQKGNSGFRVLLYGMETFGDLFTSRQKVGLTGLLQILLRTDTSGSKPLLAAAFNRVAMSDMSCTRWNAVAEKMQHTFGRQALPIVWDFAEVVPTADAPGNWESGYELIFDVVSRYPGGTTIGQTQLADACDSPLLPESTAVWFTDPPYYDAISYSDLSDFFFVWLKRALPGHPLLRDPFDPENLLTPKGREAIQDRARVVEGKPKDRDFYETAMSMAFAEGRRGLKDDGIGCVVFAHKTTEGWEALLSGMIRGGWTITGSWPIATEMGTRLIARDSAALATSVHLICRPRPEDAPVGDWNEVFRELPRRVGDWMERLQGEGVRGADLVFACIGPALEIYSRYSQVEDAEGHVIPLGGDPEAIEPHQRGFLTYVWETVGRVALAQVLGTAEARARNGAAGAVEEDARLTALFLWTLQSTSGEAADDSGEEEEDADDEEDAPQRKSGGCTLLFDVARRFAQPLGIHLPDWEGRIIETAKGVLRLLPVTERAKQLFGEDGAQVAAERFAKGPAENFQLALFPEPEVAPKISGRRGKTKVSISDEAEQHIYAVPCHQREATTLDRVHAAMLLQAGGQANALRALLQAEQERGPDFLRLANALSALYPRESEEKRLLDAMLLAVPR